MYNEELRCHAYNIMNAYSIYHDYKNRLSSSEVVRGDSIFHVNNAVLFDLTLSNIIAYLDIYLNLDDNTKNTDLINDIKSELQFNYNFNIYYNEQQNPAQFFNYMKVIYADTYPEMDEKNAERFSRLFMKNYLKFSILKKAELSGVGIDNIPELFHSYISTLSEINNKLGINTNISYDDFELLLNEVYYIRSIDPINNDKIWNERLESLTKVEFSKMDELRKDIADNYVTNWLVGRLKVSDNISFLPNQDFLDLYFQQYDIAYNKYENIFAKTK